MNRVSATAHSYAWTLEHSLIDPRLVLHHRCDEPLCTATLDLELGTYADNSWDRIVGATGSRPRRAGQCRRSRAIRQTVLAPRCCVNPRQSSTPLALPPSG